MVHPYNLLAYNRFRLTETNFGTKKAMRRGAGASQLFVWGPNGLFGTFGLFAITVDGSGTELLFDAEELVVLGHTVGARS